ncbi:MAG: hypothetical protein HY824_05060 [Acidobacteria bacterium]|nr:hypothetical protein [Acidobacteriota bacterium]
MPRACPVVLAAPVVAGLALLAAIVVSERASLGWLAQPDPRFNLAEAAGIGRAAPVVERIRRGADPNGVYSVRRGLIRTDEDLMLTPLEAAVMSGELEIVRLLEANGAQRDGRLTARLVELAAARRADDVVEYLRSAR